jgi:hypothetical protein
MGRNETAEACLTNLRLVAIMDLLPTNRHPMTIELTDSQRQALQAGIPVDVIDPATKERYVLMTFEEYERVQNSLDSQAMELNFRAKELVPGGPVKDHPVDGIPALSASIRQSQETFWRDLPELLKNPQNRGQWVSYHREERIGIGSYQELIRECVRRGLSESEYDIEVIEPHARPPWEPEEIEAGGHEVAD